MVIEFYAHGGIAAPGDTAVYQCGSPGVGIKVLKQYLFTGAKSAIGLDTSPGLCNVNDETGIKALVNVVVGWDHAGGSWQFPSLGPMNFQVQFVRGIGSIFIILKIVIHFAVPSIRLSVTEYIPDFSPPGKYYRLVQ